MRWGTVLRGTQEMQGALMALFGNYLTGALRVNFAGADLFIAALALALIPRSVPDVPLVRRVSAACLQLLDGVVLNLALQAVQVRHDVTLTLCNQYGVGQVALALSQNRLHDSSKYLLAQSLAQLLQPHAGLAIPVLGATTSLASWSSSEWSQVRALVLSDLLIGWVQRVTPPTLELPTLLALARFLVPFTEQSREAAKVFNYAVFTWVSDLGKTQLPVWLVGIAAGTWGSVFADTMSRTVSTVACVHFGVTLASDALAAWSRADPLLSLVGSIVSFQILLEAAR